MTITALREFLRHPDCVIFVGSGISMWSGLPSWTRLMDDFAAHLEAEGQSAELVRREIRSGDLLQAASYGMSKLTQASFGAFIRKAVQFGSATPHAIHKAIVALGPTSYITTNYDTLIEQALRAWRTDKFFPAPVTNKHLVELAEILSKVGRISEAPSAIFTANVTRRYELPRGGGRRFAFPPYSNAGKLSGPRMNLADRRMFMSPMSAQCVFQSRPAIPLLAKACHQPSATAAPWSPALSSNEPVPQPGQAPRASTGRESSYHPII